MISLILSILSSTFILLIFKISERIKIDVFSIIVINYLAALLLGFFLNKIDISQIDWTNATWLIFSAIIGFFFINMFFVIGISTQKAGIGVTSIASKMSVVVPMLFSILYYNEIITSIKLIGIVVAMFAVVLTVYKKRNKNIDLKHIYFPLILFVGMGLLDSLVKYSQAEYVNDELVSIFSAGSFTMAFISGIVLSFIKKVPLKQFTNRKSIITGVFLGIANFGSMYFMIKALNSNVLDSSVIFALNNIGIIAISILMGLVFFKEKVTKLNWVGIILSFLAIVILTLT
jgi:drug/metabolite transporter (DMT)-like permease